MTALFTFPLLGPVGRWDLSHRGSFIETHWLNRWQNSCYGIWRLSSLHDTDRVSTDRSSVSISITHSIQKVNDDWGLESRGYSNRWGRVTRDKTFITDTRHLLPSSPLVSSLKLPSFFQESSDYPFASAR